MPAHTIDNLLQVYLLVPLNDQSSLLSYPSVNVNSKQTPSVIPYCMHVANR